MWNRLLTPAQHEFSPDGKFLATSSDASNGSEKILALWNLTQSTPTATVASLPKDAKTFFDVTFSPDGSLLATASEDKTAQLWNTNDLSKPVKIFSGHDAMVTEVAFSPDGKVLATASFDSFVRVWQLDKPKKLIQKLAGHTAGVRTLAFSPDGTLLASAGLDSKVILWNTKTWESVMTLEAGSRVWALAFSPDGTLATANEDGSLGVWQNGSENTLVKLLGHSDTVWSVAFSSDGYWLVSSSEDGTVRFWPALLGNVRELACQKAGRNLTLTEWQEMFGTLSYNATCPQF
jgi:WD40 repeat protein